MARMNKLSARKTISVIGLTLLAIAPLAASAAPVDASLIPDGTYIVKVEAVLKDGKHMVVRMNNGMESMLTAKGAVDFSKIKSNDTIKVSLVQGKVPVYTVQ